MEADQIELLAKSLHATLIETHISYILLTRDFAFKIKKEIKTSFLDYSTLRKRKKMCEEELRVNYILAPKIYLSVDPLKRTKDSIFIGPGEGRVIDHCVRMKRLDIHKQLNVLIKNNKVKSKSLTGLAKTVASFHLSAEIKKVNRHKDLWTEFYDLYKELPSYPLLSKLKSVEDIFCSVQQFLKGAKSLFQERERKGYVRDLHGDLHTANIFMYSNPIIFDRIEFNKRFREIDVLHELAFLYMDLEASGRIDLSESFLENYLRHAKVEMHPSIFSFYKCYCANVRAKVNLIDYQNSPSGKAIREFKKYYRLMEKYSKELE